MREKYTEQQKQLVLSLFWRTELRWHEKIIDNQTKTISIESGVGYANCNHIIDNSINEKILSINGKIRARLKNNQR